MKKSSAAGSNASSVSSGSNNNDAALCSSWITRLYPQPQALPASVSAISLRSSRYGAAPTSELAPGFGPFRVGPRAVGSDGGFLSEYRRQLAAGVTVGGSGEGGSELGGRLRTVGELIRAHVSASHREFGMVSSRRKGSESSLDGNDGLASSRDAGSHHRAFNLDTVQHRHERQNPSRANGREEPFSYWNMGRLRERDFVSSACPVTLWTVPHVKKRPAITYGFAPSKFRKFQAED